MSRRKAVRSDCPGQSNRLMGASREYQTKERNEPHDNQSAGLGQSDRAARRRGSQTPSLPPPGPSFPRKPATFSPATNP